MMSRKARWEYMKEFYVRYHKALNKKEKTELLDEFCKVYKCHRKHAIRKLNGPAPGDEPAQWGGGRREVYSRRVIELLEEIWESTYYISSQRLVEVIPEWLPWLKKRYVIKEQEEQQLLSISASTIDRRLKDKKLNLRKRIYGKTKGASRYWRDQVPIQTEKPNVKEPGWTEIDLVSHSGPCSAGHFAQTINQTDLLTQWIVRRAILGKGEVEVHEAIQKMKERFPFDIKGIDSDCGSEFLNRKVITWCQDENIYQTRSRAYKKDDQSHIEQKNGSCVRRWVGWVRYDTSDAVNALNDLYENELWLFDNLFMPSMRLVKVVYKGSRRCRFYDKPKTPLERLVEYDPTNPKVKGLLRLKKSLDPFELSENIERKLRKLESLAAKTFPRGHTIRYNPNRVFDYGASYRIPWYPEMTRFRRIWGKEKSLQTW